MEALVRDRLHRYTRGEREVSIFDPDTKKQTGRIDLLIPAQLVEIKRFGPEWRAAVGQVQTYRPPAALPSIYKRRIHFFGLKDKSPAYVERTKKEIEDYCNANGIDVTYDDDNLENDTVKNRNAEIAKQANEKRDEEIREARLQLLTQIPPLALYDKYQKKGEYDAVIEALLFPNGRIHDATYYEGTDDGDLQAPAFDPNWLKYQDTGSRFYPNLKMYSNYKKHDYPLLLPPELLPPLKPRGFPVAPHPRPLWKFLKTTKQLTFGVDKLMPMTVFRRCYEEWVRETKSTHCHWDPDYYTDVFSEFNISVADGKIEWNGRLQPCTFLHGVGMAFPAPGIVSEQFLLKGILE